MRPRAALARTLPVVIALLAAVLPTPVAHAQPLARPTADWRTLETLHFVVHYPAEMAAWTEPMVRRLEAIHDAVDAAVDFEPGRRTTVIVDDPSGQSNGVSFGPVIYLWPTPPDPSSPIGENRDWSELLTVHEYAHTAHLSRPSRNPRDRFLFGLIPFPVQPIALRTPRWVLEGYATYLEGKLTGSGRPYGVWRPAVLREWALEGKLPPYGALDRREGYWEGSMAYLVGSAYLEWLVERSGEKSLPDLWARMTARRRRSFADAFTGVFGGPPSELYGEFTVDVTAKALAARDRLQATGLVAGERFQRLDGFADDPAVSRDGERLAITLEPADRPSRIVIWSTAPDTAAARREREERERLLAADPEDVPAVDWRPRPREPLATLWPVGGRGHRAPRFLPDGERLLVVRSEGLGDGRARSDLFEWTWRTGALRQVTRGAGIRSADPTPDGRRAIAVRCLAGICDVVRVDLETGSVDRIAAGAPQAPFHRPRVSPDGTRAAVGVQRESGWRIALVDLASGEIRDVSPDDGASRFDPAWLPGGEALIAVSDAGGVHDLERIDLATGTAQPLTRVIGAALTPEPDPSGRWTWFLTLQSRGHDVQRIEADHAPLDRIVALDASLAPAAPAVAPDPIPLESDPLPPSRAYGLGPRGYTLLPRGSIAPSGTAAGVTLASADPVGRLIWTLDGLAGTDGAWHGAGAHAALRRYRPALSASAFAARHEPSEQDAVRPEGLDADYAGGGVEVELERNFLSRIERIALGASVGRLEPDGEPDRTRGLAFAEGSFRTLVTPGPWRLSGAVALTGAAGSTGGDSWTRATASLALGAGRGAADLFAETTVGGTGGDPPAWETFAAGGVTSPLVDPSLLSQRLPLLAVPVGYVLGDRIWTIRVGAHGRGGLTPFWWAGTAGDELGDWKRVTGIEWVLDQRAIPYLGLPASRLEAGVARVLDEPLRHETRGWLSLSFRP
jgi:Tol biopolymer transport system component